MGGDFQAAWEVLVFLLSVGFVLGVILAVIFGAIRIGWKLAPFVFVGALLVWFLGG